MPEAGFGGGAEGELHFGVEPSVKFSMVNSMVAISDEGLVPGARSPLCPRSVGSKHLWQWLVVVSKGGSL